MSVQASEISQEVDLVLSGMESMMTKCSEREGGKELKDFICNTSEQDREEGWWGEMKNREEE